MAACADPTDLHNAVSARITIVKDDVASRVAVGRAVKNAKADQTQKPALEKQISVPTYELIRLNASHLFRLTADQGILNKDYI